MEDANTNPEEAFESSVLTKNLNSKSRLSTKQAEEGHSVEVNEEFKTRQRQPQEKKAEESEKKMINLQRDLSTLVTNIQTAADARESVRRTELEEARRLRLERLENDVKSSQEKYEEITSGWSIAEHRMIPQELQEALNKQQQLFAALIADKKQLINDLQQELKVGDDRYVKDLRKQAEELDLMMERMEDQIKTLTKAYREELAQMERVYHQESEVLITRDKSEWEQSLKELWDNELERLTQRTKKVEEYEAIIHNLMLETADDCHAAEMEKITESRDLLREHQKTKSNNLIVILKKQRQQHDGQLLDFNLACMKSRVMSLQKELTKLRAKYTNQEKQFAKTSRCLSQDYKRNIQRYEDIQKKIKHFAAADVRQFKEMWLMVEAELMQLVERALTIDSLICKQQLGLAWQRPQMPFIERFSPIKPKKETHKPARQAIFEPFQTGETLHCGQKMIDASVGPSLAADTESADMEMHKEGTEVQSESSAQVEEGKLTTETLKKVLELLCDEAGFLIEDKLLDLLASLEKEEQTVVKLGSLLCSFGIEAEDVPKLAHFLLKYKHWQREQTEDVCVDSGEFGDQGEEVKTNSATHLTSELIDPNHVVPALRSFLEQLTRSRVSSACKKPNLQHTEACHTAEDEAYWESLGNIISEDKLKLWDIVEDQLKQYHVVLTEVSELTAETQSLEQQNTELRMLLQQSLNSGVNP